MTNTQTYLLGTAFWLSGIAAFAGFGVAMSRPNEAPPSSPIGQPTELTAAQVHAVGPQGKVVVLPTIEIVGQPAPEPLRFEPFTVSASPSAR